jgi:hypothetical protein
MLDDPRSDLLNLILNIGIWKKPPELVCHLRSSLQAHGDFLLLGHPDVLFLAGDGIDFSIAVITGEGD